MKKCWILHHSYSLQQFLCVRQHKILNFVCKTHTYTHTQFSTKIAINVDFGFPHLHRQLPFLISYYILTCFLVTCVDILLVMWKIEIYLSLLHQVDTKIWINYPFSRKFADSQPLMARWRIIYKFNINISKFSGSMASSCSVCRQNCFLPPFGNIRKIIFHKESYSADVSVVWISLLFFSFYFCARHFTNCFLV